jgi:hypothetical protein
MKLKLEKGNNKLNINDKGELKYDKFDI